MGARGRVIEHTGVVKERMGLRSAIEIIKRYWPRLVNFWISLVGLASITAIVWCFDPIDDLPAKIALNLLAVVMSLLYFADGLSNDERRHKFGWTPVCVSALSVGAFVALVGERIDAPGLAVSVVSLVAALPAFVIYWDLTKGEHLLQLWLIPIVVTASLYVVHLIAPDGLALDLVLLPVPVVSYASVVWALVTRFLIRARRKDDRPIWGPALESLTMLFLVAPLVALTMLAVNALSVDDVWVAVSGAIVGILFGSAVSQPIGQFMRDLGKLSQNDKFHGGGKTE